MIPKTQRGLPRHLGEAIRLLQHLLCRLLVGRRLTLVCPSRRRLRQANLSLKHLNQLCPVRQPKTLLQNLQCKSVVKKPPPLFFREEVLLAVKAPTSFKLQTT